MCQRKQTKPFVSIKYRPGLEKTENNEKVKVK